MAILKKILFPGMQEAAQIAVTQLKRKADAENAIKALTLTDVNTDVDDDGHPVYTIGLAVDGKTILKGGNDALKSGLKLVYHAAKQEGDTQQSAHIALTDNVGTELSVIPVSDIVGNGVLKSSDYNAGTGILTLTFTQADGGENAVEVDLKAMLDINDMSIAENSKNYLEVTLGTAGVEGETQAVFGAKTVKVAEASDSKTGLVDAKDVKDYVDSKATDLAVKAKGDDYITAGVDAGDNKQINVTADVQALTATAGTIGVYTEEGAETTAPIKGSLSGTANSLVDGADVAAKVKTYVDGAIAIEVARADAKVLAAVKALKFTDAAVAGKYVSAVSETDGVISVERANVADAVLTGYAKGEKPASTVIAATDDVKGAIAKLEHQVDAAKAAATTKVVEGTDAGNNLEIVPTTSDDDGSTTYTINLTDVASKTALDDEIGARKAADTKLTQDLAAEVDRAQAAEQEIADKVGLTGAEGSRTFTPTTNYGGASATVMANMEAIDTKLKEVEGTLAGVQYKVNGTTLEFFGITEKKA